MSQATLTPTPTLIVDPDAVYEEGTVALALGITLASLLAARRSGELRFVRRGRRIFITGRNLLAWLDPLDPVTLTPVERERVSHD
jgi:hypothetical protein